MKYFLNTLLVLFTINTSLAQTFTDTIYQRSEKSRNIYKIAPDGMRLLCSPKDTLPFTGILILTWKGLKNSEIPYIKGLAHGKMTHWYRGSLQKSFTMTIKNGVDEGEYIKWYKNGQIKIKTNKKHFDFDGKYMEWHENGQLKLKGHKKEHKFHGKVRYWDENGFFIKTEQYKNGVLKP